MRLFRALISHQKVFGALFCFLWGSFFVVAAIIALRDGKMYVGHFGPEITPDSDPSGFRTGISMCFVFALVGFLLGMRDLIRYLRERSSRP
jgi:hypothetical protein